MDGVKELLPLAVWLAVAVPALALAEPLLSHVDVYTSGTCGYHTFRIPTIETAPNGTVVAFAEARKHSGADPGFGRQDIDLALKVSTDGGRTWSKPRPGAAATPCCCAIERLTLKSAGDDRDRIIWTGARGPGRKSLVVRVSYDEGKTFPHERVISTGPAAYSDLTILRDKTAAVLWERANYRFITFTRFGRDFLEPATDPP